MSPLHHPPTRPHTRATPVAVLGTVIALMAVLSGCSPEEASAGAPPSVAKPLAHASSERTPDGASLHPPGERPGRLPDEPPGPAHGCVGRRGRSAPRRRRALRRHLPRRDEARPRTARRPARGGPGRRARRRHHLRQQRLALVGLPAAAARRGRHDVRDERRRRPLGRECRRVPPRVGGRGRRRGRGRHDLAVGARGGATACARSTPTSPGTTSCAPTRRRAAARPCTPTRRGTRGCSSDPPARTRAARAARAAPGRAVRDLPRAPRLDGAVEARRPLGRRRHDGQARAVRAHGRGRPQRTRRGRREPRALRPLRRLPRSRRAGPSVVDRPGS